MDGFRFLKFDSLYVLLFKFIYFLILMHNAFLPILVGWLPQSCVKSHWQNNHADDIYI